MRLIPNSKDFVTYFLEETEQNDRIVHEIGYSSSQKILYSSLTVY